MGKKYIVELGRCERLYKANIDGNGKPELTWLSPEVDLMQYPEPDLEQIRKEAYEEGYKDGLQFNIDDARLKEEYQQGLNDAWDAARKIISMPESDLLDLFDNVYSTLCTSVQVILKYDAFDSISRIKKYEDSKLEIMVGDEVETEDGMKMVIVALINKDFAGLGDDGKFMFGELDGTITRTGRHFPEITTVLKKMRGEKI